MTGPIGSMARDYGDSPDFTHSVWYFEHFFGIKNVCLNHILSLTPGDFVVVKNKAEILDCLNDKNELIKMLEQEQINKTPVRPKIGFI